MILVDNYFLAILCCVICCTCWGSWANTQKMVAAKKWSFELFYWDLTIGLFFTALLGAVTLGSMGSEGRTFLQDLATMDWSSIKYAFLGGVVWNFGNIFLTAAIAVAGMSVGFPIGGGLAWIGGIVFNYLLISLAGQTYQGNQLLLWSGVLNIIVATLDPQYVTGGTGTLTPYTGVFFFAVGILVSTPIFNAFAMKHPVEGRVVTMKDYFAGDIKTHLTGMLGGFIWMGGMVVSFMGAGAANPAVSYALSNAAPVIAIIWGVFVWKEFKDAPKGTNKLIAAMFALFIVGLISITLSN